MRLRPYNDLLEYAKKNKITIPAMNTFNLESSQAVVAAADEMNCPIIVQVHDRDLDFEGADFAAAIVETAAHNASVMVALGLDHGTSVDKAITCIDAGFSGVMIDLSSENYAVNVKNTLQVVEYAHARGVSVEAELGTIKTGSTSLDEIAAGYTDPVIARDFVKDTGIDCLAVSIGTAHGEYAQTPRINFDLLEELVNSSGCPIVVHGGSGTPDEYLLRMVRMGVAKLNIGTIIYNAYRNTVRELTVENPKIRPSEMGMIVRDAIKDAAKPIIALLTQYRREQ